MRSFSTTHHTYLIYGVLREHRVLLLTPIIFFFTFSEVLLATSQHYLKLFACHNTLILVKNIGPQLNLKFKRRFLEFPDFLANHFSKRKFVFSSGSDYSHHIFTTDYITQEITWHQKSWKCYHELKMWRLFFLHLTFSLGIGFDEHANCSISSGHVFLKNLTFNLLIVVLSLEFLVLTRRSHILKTNLQLKSAGLRIRNLRVTVSYKFSIWIRYSERIPKIEGVLKSRAFMWLTVPF